MHILRDLTGLPHNPEYSTTNGMLFSDIESGITGRAWLGRAQEDLNKYRQRIDTNAESQKEHSERMDAMKNKVKHPKMIEKQKIGKDNRLSTKNCGATAQSGRATRSRLVAVSAGRRFGLSRRYNSRI